MTVVRIQVRRGTASQWSDANPILSSGEWGLDTTNRVVKMGNGVTRWNALSSFGAEGPQGPQGPQGETGPQGEVGPPGADGTNGVTTEYIEQEISAVEDLIPVVTVGPAPPSDPKVGDVWIEKAAE